MQHCACAGVCLPVCRGPCAHWADWADTGRLSLQESSEELQCQELKAILDINGSTVLDWEWAICSRLSCYWGGHKQRGFQLVQSTALATGSKTKPTWGRSAEAVGRRAHCSQPRQEVEKQPRGLGWHGHWDGYVQLSHKLEFESCGK